MQPSQRGCLLNDTNNAVHDALASHMKLLVTARGPSCSLRFVSASGYPGQSTAPGYPRPCGVHAAHTDSLGRSSASGYSDQQFCPRAPTPVRVQLWLSRPAFGPGPPTPLRGTSCSHWSGCGYPVWYAASLTALHSFRAVFYSANDLPVMANEAPQRRKGGPQRAAL